MGLDLERQNLVHERKNLNLLHQLLDRLLLLTAMGMNLRLALDLDLLRLVLLKQNSLLLDLEPDLQLVMDRLGKLLLHLLPF